MILESLLKIKSLKAHGINDYDVMYKKINYTLSENNKTQTEILVFLKQRLKVMDQQVQRTIPARN